MHAEYVKLQRSAADGKVFDMIEAAHDRYVASNVKRNAIGVWKFNLQVSRAPAGTLLRVQVGSPFLLRWTSDEWQHVTDTRSMATGVGIEFVDILMPQQETPVSFTFLWVEENRWEGKDYEGELRPARAR